MINVHKQDSNSLEDKQNYILTAVFFVMFVS